MTQAAPGDWWQTLYDDTVAEVFLVHKDPEELRATIAFLLEQLLLKQSGTVFDQCCGIGRLSIPLARAGLSVIGVDQSQSYIDRASAQARQASLSCEFHVADAFTYVPSRPVDAVVNWSTSFGNADDARNLEMLRRAWEALRPGGRLALDYQHVPRVLRTFQPCLIHRLEQESGETLIVRESQIDLADGTLRQQWTFLLPDGRRFSRPSAIRLYLPHELARMLREAGFVDLSFHGGLRAEPLTLDSPRCILLARRPAP